MTHKQLFPSRRLHLLRGCHFHNFIVTLDRLDLLPAPVAFLFALALPLLAPLVWPDHRGLAFGLPAAALLIEAASLLSGRLPGRSPSPFAGPLLLFALGHGAATLLPPLLPTALALPLHAALQAGLLAAMLYGFWVEPWRVGLRREEVQIGQSATKVAATGSPAATREFTALVISDLHLDVPGPREKAMLDHARAVRPDLILIPGDLTNLTTVDHPACAAATISFLQDLRALAPVFVSRGTPEVDDPDWVRSLCESAGVTLLDGSCADFPAPDTCEEGPAFTLVGVSYAGPFEHRQEQLRGLMGAARRPAVLLFHSPDIIETAADCGVALQLSGHTHGGQVRLPLFGPLFTASRYGRRFAAGRYQVGPTTLIVSRGVGMEGAGAPRLRFLCPPEVVAIKLVL